MMKLNHSLGYINLYILWLTSTMIELFL